MKNLLVMLVFLLSGVGLAQEIKDLNFVGSLSDGYIPVARNNEWGFINSQGEIVIDFRSDLAFHKEKISGDDLGIASIEYPVISEGMAIIKKEIDGIYYYGFIDVNGKIVIEPQYLNVSKFRNGYSLALKVEERILGRNNLLDIKVKSYIYDLVLLNKKGEIIKYLSGPFPVALSREKLRQPPAINGKWITPELVAVKDPKKKWELYKI